MTVAANITGKQYDIVCVDLPTLGIPVTRKDQLTKQRNFDSYRLIVNEALVDMFACVLVEIL